jgi:hypothetical protein
MMMMMMITEKYQCHNDNNIIGSLARKWDFWKCNFFNVRSRLELPLELPEILAMF